MLKLNLPEYNYLTKTIRGKLNIYDSVRKKYVVLTPEEWVRQHFVHYLIDHKKIPLKYISLESAHKYNTLRKRSDILVYNRDLAIHIMIECKAPSVELDKKVVFQAATYYSTLKPSFIVLTNGIETICIAINPDGVPEYLPELPNFGTAYSGS